VLRLKCGRSTNGKSSWRVSKAGNEWDVGGRCGLQMPHSSALLPICRSNRAEFQDHPRFHEADSQLILSHYTTCSDTVSMTKLTTSEKGIKAEGNMSKRNSPPTAALGLLSRRELNLGLAMTILTSSHTDHYTTEDPVNVDIHRRCDTAEVVGWLAVGRIEHSVAVMLAF
jgi:hypothetical protein